MALTKSQLAKLRQLPVGQAGNRLALAMDLLEMTQVQLGALAGLTQPYVSAVARGAHDTITVENAHKFAAVFGCAIEDLFPPAYSRRGAA